MNELELRNKIGKLIKEIIPIKYQIRPMTSHVKKLQTIGELSKDITFVEIGADVCKNAQNIIQHIDVKKLILIDPYIDDEERYKLAKNNANFFSCMTLIRQTSKDAVKSFQDNSVDVVYIDGNHKYDYVKEDISLWFPKVKKDGIIGGHDFRGHALDVILAVTDYVNENNLRHKLQSGGVDWWIRK